MKTQVKKGISNFIKVSDYCPAKKVGKFYFTINIPNLNESDFHEIKEGEIAEKLEKFMNSGVVDSSRNDELEEENSRLYEALKAMSRLLKVEKNEEQITLRDAGNIDPYFLIPSKEVEYTNKDEELKEFLRGLFKG